MPIYKSTAARNAACGAIVNLIDTGSTYTAGQIRIHPAGESSDSLVTLSFSGVPAFEASPTNGVVEASGVPFAANASGTGTAEWFEVTDRDGSLVWSGDVGTVTEGTAAMQLSSTAIISGAYIQVNLVRFTVPV